MVLTWVGAGLAPAHYQDFPGVENPFGIVALATVLKRVEGVGGILFAAGVLGALASLVVRFARARGLGAPAAQVVRVRRRARLCTAGAADPPIPDFLKWTLAPVSLSAAAAVAVLRYRLYDIDRLINRTLVYGGLTAVLGLGYAGAVLLLGQLFGDVGERTPSWAVAGATLAVAALFQPARRRIQQAVDRRFNRRKYNTAKTIQAFSTRLRDQVDLDTLSTELLAVTDQTMQPTQASLWLQPPHTAPRGYPVVRRGQLGGSTDHVRTSSLPQPGCSTVKHLSDGPLGGILRARYMVGV